MPGSKTTAVVLSSAGLFSVDSFSVDFLDHPFHQQTGQRAGGIRVARLSTKAITMASHDEQSVASEAKHAEAEDRM